MRRFWILGILLLAGCQNIVGPFQRTPARVDDPSLTIAEQQQRARERLALPDDSGLTAPVSPAIRNRKDTDLNVGGGLRY
jgi:hypothetical protein